MLSSDDVVDLDLEFRHPGVVTAQRTLDGDPAVIHVPLTSPLRPFESEVAIEPDRANGLDAPSSAQCQHLHSVSSAASIAASGVVRHERIAYHLTRC